MPEDEDKETLGRLDTNSLCCNKRFSQSICWGILRCCIQSLGTRGGLEPEGFKSARGRRLTTNTPGNHQYVSSLHNHAVSPSLRKPHYEESSLFSSSNLLSQDFIDKIARHSMTQKIHNRKV